MKNIFQSLHCLKGLKNGVEDFPGGGGGANILKDLKDLKGLKGLKGGFSEPFKHCNV